MNELALFAGAGGGILGGHLLGWRTVCAVEIEPYAASVLLARQNDGILPPFPVWDDIRTFGGRPWRGIVDVVSGGFPCQDISAAGRGAGINGERSGLWREMARVIREVRPRYAFVENSPVLTSRGIDRVLGDLAEMGYDAEWCVLGADDVGAPHIRKRIWILAYAMHSRFGGVFQSERELGGDEPPDTWGNGKIQSLADTVPARQWRNVREKKAQRDVVAYALRSGFQEWRQTGEPEGTECITETHSTAKRHGCTWWAAEPDVGRVVNGLAGRVDRLKAIGNGQVPAVAALAWEILTERMEAA